MRRISTVAVFLLAGVCLAQTQSFTESHGVMLVRVKVAGVERTMLLDTGAQLTLISAKASGLDQKTLAGRDNITISSRGQKSSIPVVATTISIGRTTFFQIPVGVADLSAVAGGVDGILGNDVLSKFKHIIIDYNAKAVTFQ